TTWIPFPHFENGQGYVINVGAGTSAVPVSQEAASLMPNTTYQVKLVATKPFAAGNATAQTSFTTTAIAPEAKAFATEVEKTDASLGAEINPNGSATTYHLEYVDATHYQPSEANPYAEGEAVPASPAPVGSGTATVTVTHHIAELSPDTVYHYRVVAENAIGTTESADQTIHTPPPNFATESECANQTYHTGASALLPDCRAYEMVTPIEKGGSDIVGAYWSYLRWSFDQAAPSGEKIAYGAPLSFGDQEGSQYANEYIATRGSDGWSTHGVDAKLPIGKWEDVLAFSRDLTSNWIRTPLPITADSMHIPGLANLYRHDLTGAAVETLTNTEPSTYQVNSTDEGSLQFGGASSDGRKSFFQIQAALTSNAANNGRGQVYEFSDGQLHLVSVLPDGGADPGYSSVGSVPFGGEERFQRSATLYHAVSEDGSRVFWASAPFNDGERGKVYVRINPDRQQSALNGEECTEPEKSCTILLSIGSDSFFVAATPDGSEALIGEGPENKLYRVNVDTGTRTLVAGEIIGTVVGTSDDLSHVYFVSPEVLASGGAAGKPNLYLDQEGTDTYIATLASGDVGTGSNLTIYSAVDARPIQHAAAVTPDGGAVTFMSQVPLTGYDNMAANGEAATEVYVYDAGTKELHCVSCNPSGGRPRTGTLRYTFGAGLEGYNRGGGTAAAWLPTWEHDLDPPTPLSPDGKRVFFNSFDALVPQDTNGKQDVYEWEALGAGPPEARCTEESPSFSEQDGGCVNLISSGESKRDSEFVASAANGRDAFIRTESSLNPRDPGLIDIYDAREKGGLPLPLYTAACEGETCQNVPAAPNDPTPGSASYKGPGNVVEKQARKKKHAKKRHRTHRHRRHHRVHRRRHRRANNNRRAAR
ncbi:MAG TPA: fibronectin type III domain-containing protein, partial [Mycobacterium sp.]|nr:fibronectin type III domain-containing protein [Mycobacterium sp.]